jgi:hypothetical protein
LLFFVLLVTLVGSLLLSYVFDRIKLSKYVFGMNNCYKN